MSKRKEKNRREGIQLLRNAFGLSKARLRWLYGAVTILAFDYFGLQVRDSADRRILLIIMGIVVVICACILGYGLIKAISGNISIRISNKKRVYIKKADFQINMIKFLQSLSTEELKRTLFVMGLDASGSLEISSKNGIVYAVMKLLDDCVVVENDNICNPREYIQEKIKEHIEKYLKHSNPELETEQISIGFDKPNLPIGECIFVEIPSIRKMDSSDRKMPCNLLFVVNSRKENYGNDSVNTITDEGKGSFIFPSIFAALKTDEEGKEETDIYTRVLVGALGTNDLKHPYRPVFSQIINQYAWYNGKGIKELYISVRQVDYEKHTKLSQLEAYARACEAYYSKQNEQTNER